MKRLVFLGPPGAGKGTQAKVLAEVAQIPHISTGDILRNARAQGTALGKEAQSYMDKGELVPDELLLDLIRERLNQPDAKEGWILDGFPRNEAQASFLHKLIEEFQQDYYALNLEVPDEVLIDRLLKRGFKDGRTDDNEKTISRRLEVYQEQTAPVIDFYRDHGNLHSVDGDRPPEQVTESLKQIVKS
ncbi:MAG: adenylate kinase [Moorea sp. SIO2B7]|nr:adenylate kinase [Moorena sp. SIO2B7]